MKRFPLFLLLAAGLVHAQAIAPLPPEPVMEPAPSIPTPGFTPAGAGASHGMLLAPEREQTLPLSPNKRILPPSKEPGIWAADEPKAMSLATQQVVVDGVAVDGFDASMLQGAKTCADQMSKVVSQYNIGKDQLHLTWLGEQCWAAKLLRYCAEKNSERDSSKTLRSFSKWAQENEQRECSGVEVAWSHSNVEQCVSAVTEQWDKDYGHLKPSR